MPASLNNIPGTPPPLASQSKVQSPTHPPSGDLDRGTLYTLDYLRGNQKISKIFRFPSSLTFSNVVESCKKYCGDNNFRFVWIELTINVLPEFARSAEEN